MEREPNMDADGRSFTEDVIEAVWHKARTMESTRRLRVDAWGWTNREAGFRQHPQQVWLGD